MPCGKPFERMGLPQVDWEAESESKLGLNHTAQIAGL